MNAAIVAGAVGLIGVALGGVLQAEAARISLLREKQLAAASDMSAALTSLFTTMERKMRALTAVGSGDAEDVRAEWFAQVSAAVDLAREELRKAVHILGRVEIVFGVNSLVAESAVELAKHSHDVVEEMDKRSPNPDDFERAYKTATKSLEVFHRRANDVFSKPVWHRHTTPTRIALGFLVIALALSCAVWLHSGARLESVHHPETPCFSNGVNSCAVLGQPPVKTPKTIPAYTDHRRANWQNPLAIFVAVAGLGVGAAIIVSRPRVHRG